MQNSFPAWEDKYYEKAGISGKYTYEEITGADIYESYAYQYRNYRHRNDFDEKAIRQYPTRLNMSCEINDISRRMSFGT